MRPFQSFANEHKTIQMNLFQKSCQLRQSTKINKKHPNSSFIFMLIFRRPEVFLKFGVFLDVFEKLRTFSSVLTFDFKTAIEIHCTFFFHQCLLTQRSLLMRLKWFLFEDLIWKLVQRNGIFAVFLSIFLKFVPFVEDSQMNMLLANRRVFFSRKHNILATFLVFTCKQFTKHQVQ